MADLVRIAGLALAGAALASCSSTSDVVGTKAMPTAAVQPVAYAAGAQLPPLAYKGYWFLADDTERDCTLEFSTSPALGSAEIYAVQPTGECVSSLKHIAGWGRANGAIVLYNAEGQNVGSFGQIDVVNYVGEVTIDTGQVFTANLKKIA